MVNGIACGKEKSQKFLGARWCISRSSYSWYENCGARAHTHLIRSLTRCVLSLPWVVFKSRVTLIWILVCFGSGWPFGCVTVIDVSLYSDCCCCCCALGTYYNVFLYSIRSPHTFGLMYQNAILNALKSTHRDDGMIPRHFRVHFFFVLSAASLQLFLCVPLSVSASISFLSAYHDIHLYACVCVCVCVILLYIENSYSIFFFSSASVFIYIGPRAVSYCIHSFVHSAHRYSIVCSMFHAYIFFPLYFHLLLLLLFRSFASFFYSSAIAVATADVAAGVSCSRLVNFSCLWKIVM